jgi:C1A family cysteine protease
VGDSAILRQNAPLRHVSHKELSATVPASYDWRQPDQGRPVGVTAVKDQGQCGSCWAFSATEEVESAWILAGHAAVDLAPQQTVSCDTTDGGCNGGDTVSAYAYMEKNGVEAEKSYPYTSGASGDSGTCKYKSSEVVAKISSFVYATPSCDNACNRQDETQLAASLYNSAPVSICVDAEPWQSYTSGILTAASGCKMAYSDLDHCVQLVGFGVDADVPFWSVRNSWAADWGEAGYIRLKRGDNTCGVADEATIVKI